MCATTFIKWRQMWKFHLDPQHDPRINANSEKFAFLRVEVEFSMGEFLKDKRQLLKMTLLIMGHNYKVILQVEFKSSRREFLKDKRAS